MKNLSVIQSVCIFILFLTIAFNTQNISAQGCVAIKGNATSCMSSLYEHGLVNGTYVKRERNSTSSFGIGDIRFAAYRWMLDPAKSTKGNIQLGLGIKLPTGDYNYKDYFYNVGPNGTKELRPVDQSIQLGDGGTGFTFEVNAFYNFIENFGVYGNLFDKST